jgi:phosphocarrier protein HPr
MIERTATIASTVGLHARPASLFAEAAAQYEDLEITIAAEGEPADEAMDATSILSLMSLGAGHGDTVVIRTDGVGAEHALDQLAQILETNHDTE